MVTKVYVLASPRVTELVFQLALRHRKQQVKEFLLAAAGQTALGGFYGMMFEQHGHAVVPKGVTVLLRELLCGSKRQPPRNEERRVRAALGPIGTVGPNMVADAIAPDQPFLSYSHGEEPCDAACSDEEDESHHRGGADFGPCMDGGYTEQLAAQWALQAVQLEEEEEEVQLPRVNHVWDQPGLEIASRDSFYLQPCNSNNPAWDALYCCGEKRYIMQYTVSSRHGVKAAPIMQLLGRLSPADMGCVHMVFVVPSDPVGRYHEFSAQPWRGVGGHVLKNVPQPLQGMRQWVMKLPLEAGSREGSGGGAPKSRGDSGGGGPS